MKKTADLVERIVGIELEEAVDDLLALLLAVVRDVQLVQNLPRPPAAALIFPASFAVAAAPIPRSHEPDGPGPVVVGGTVFVNSGCAFRRRHAGQRPARVLHRWEVVLALGRVCLRRGSGQERPAASVWTPTPGRGRIHTSFEIARRRTERTRHARCNSQLRRR